MIRRANLPIPRHPRNISWNSGLTSKRLGRVRTSDNAPGKLPSILTLHDSSFPVLPSFPAPWLISRLRFALFHPEKIESAQTRYANEVKRVVGVLDRVLQGKDWLVGDKCTYADLAFVMWNFQIDFIMQGHGWNIADYPNFKRWQEAMLARDSLKKVVSVLMDKEVKSAGRA